MPNVTKIRTNDLEIAPSRPAFFLRATVKGLKILSELLVTAKEIRDDLRAIRDIQSKQGHLYTPDEATVIMNISSTKLQGMKNDGVLVEGIHYWQDGDTVRYFSNFATKPLNSKNAVIATSERTPSNSSPGPMDPNY